jgi:predicted nucleic acid-binding protein
MSLLVSDANIFIDLEEGGILEALFQLEAAIGVPDILFAEELEAQHAHLIGLGLRCIELRADAVRRVEALVERYRKPSRLDLAALATAEQERCPLLTGDRCLREAAEAEGLAVFGTLWVAEQLVQDGLLTAAGLKGAYDRMRRRGRRLPWDKVDTQLKRLGSR